MFLTEYSPNIAIIRSHANVCNNSIGFLPRQTRLYHFIDTEVATPHFLKPLSWF